MKRSCCRAEQPLQPRTESGREGGRGRGEEGKEGRGEEGKRGRGEEGKRGRGEEGKRGRGEEGKRGRGEEGKRGRGEEGKRGRGEEGKRGRGEEGKRGRGEERDRGRERVVSLQLARSPNTLSLCKFGASNHTSPDPEAPLWGRGLHYQLLLGLDLSEQTAGMHKPYCLIANDHFDVFCQILFMTKLQ